MGLRNATSRMGWIPVAVLLVLLWTIVTAIDITGTMASFAGLGGNYVGQTFIGGVAGLLVLLGFGTAVAFLYDAMSGDGPAPEPFPPQ